MLASEGREGREERGGGKGYSKKNIKKSGRKEKQFTQTHTRLVSALRCGIRAQPAPNEISAEIKMFYTNHIVIGYRKGRGKIGVTKSVAYRSRSWLCGVL